MNTKLIRRAAELCLGWLIAVFGTAVINSPLSKLYRPQSINAVLVRELSLSVIVSALLGFLIYHRWQTDTARWVWIIGLAFLGLRSLLLLLGGSEGGLWFQISGVACGEGFGIACRNYFVVTIPSVRAISYSAGAWVCFLLGMCRISGHADGAHDVEITDYH
jgi:hypothetical protein